MNLIFMNSFEKKMDEGRVLTGSVSICEQYGVWHIYWNEPSADASRDTEYWYEGTVWEEMLLSFRKGVHAKMSEGFYPLIEGFPSPADGPNTKAKLGQILDYYSSLHCSKNVYEELCKWRRSQAAREGRAPYLIASNRLLRMVGTFLPHTQDELKQIPGLGETKSELYGEAVLGITQAQERGTTFPLDWVAGEVSEHDVLLWAYQQKEAKLRLDAERQKARVKLLRLLSDGASIGEASEKMSLTRREILQWVEELHEEGYDVHAFIDRQLLEVPLTEQERVWKAFDEQGDRYLKPVLMSLFTEEERKDKELGSLYESLRLIRLQYRKAKERSAQAAVLNPVVV